MNTASNRLALAGAVLAALFALPLAAKTEGRVELVTEGGIGKTWGAAPGAKFAAPGYPAAMKERAANVCLSIGYTLNVGDGVPGDLSLLQAWSRDGNDVALTDAELEPFVQAAAAALKQWRFEAKSNADRAVTTYTSATMVFAGAPATQPPKLPDQCRITDLNQFFGEKGKGRSLVDKALLDRMSLQMQQNRSSEVQAANQRRSGY
jgi:hypothetical protein